MLPIDIFDHVMDFSIMQTKSQLSKTCSQLNTRFWQILVNPVLINIALAYNVAIGNLERVKSLIKEKNVEITERLAIDTIKSGHIKILKFLWPQLYEKDIQHYIEIALQQGDHKIVKFIIERIDDYDYAPYLVGDVLPDVGLAELVVTKFGPFTDKWIFPINTCYVVDTDSAQFVLSNCKNMKRTTRHSLISRAIDINNYDVVKLLWSHYKIRKDLRYKMLRNAIYGGNSDIIKFLLTKFRGILRDDNAKIYEAIDDATYSDNIKVIKFFFENDEFKIYKSYFCDRFKYSRYPHDSRVLRYFISQS